MWNEYFFYLMGLPEKERKTQILMLITFWIIMFCVGVLIEYIKKRKK